MILSYIYYLLFFIQTNFSDRSQILTYTLHPLLAYQTASCQIVASKADGMLALLVREPHRAHILPVNATGACGCEGWAYQADAPPGIAGLAFVEYILPYEIWRALEVGHDEFGISIC